MKQKLYYNEIIKDKLRDQILSLFPIQFLSVGEIKFGGNVLIAVVEFEGIDSLDKNWNDFNSYISTEILSLKNDEFTKWNFYVFYLSKEKVCRELKYEIENNKFSSRKIVHDCCKIENNINTVSNIVRQYITNDSIVEVKIEKERDGICKCEIIDNALNISEFPERKSEIPAYLELVLLQIEKSVQNEI